MSIRANTVKWAFCLAAVFYCGIDQAAAQPYQLHNDGSIYQFTGDPCHENSCMGWQLLDKNPQTKAIVASGTGLFQLHANGMIWRYTGTPCSGNICNSWQLLDNNPQTKLIVGNNNELYQLHHSGALYRYTGTPCSGNNCFGWQLLDKNPATVALALGTGTLFQLHANGMIWRYTGTPCSGNTCNGWQLLDKNPQTRAIVAIVGELYQLHANGMIWRSTGTPCSGNNCFGGLYRYTGAPCSGNTCLGWQMLDKNPQSKTFAAGAGQFYQLHGSGWIYRFTGTPCSGNTCSGWELLDNNPRTTAIVMGSSAQPAATAAPRAGRGPAVAASNDCTQWTLPGKKPPNPNASSVEVFRMHSLDWVMEVETQRGPTYTATIRGYGPSSDYRYIGEASVRVDAGPTPNFSIAIKWSADDVKNPADRVGWYIGRINRVPAPSGNETPIYEFRFVDLVQFTEKDPDRKVPWTAEPVLPACLKYGSSPINVR
jgi:hypothetical protein